MPPITGRSFASPVRFVPIELIHFNRTSPGDEEGETAALAGRLSSHAVYIVVQGGGLLYAGNKGFPLYAGSCLLLPSGADVQLNPDETGPFELFRLLYTAEGGAALAEDAEELQLDDLPLLRGRLQRLMALETEEGPGQLELQILFQQILLLLWQEKSLEQRDWTGDDLKGQWESDEQREAEEAVEQTIAYLHSSYRENIQIGRLAGDAHMSRWRYGSLFKSLTGRTPTDYLTALRISLSRQHLADESAPKLREIAGKVGFQDEYYFSRRFKQTTGHSPSAYREAGAVPPRIVCLQYLGELLTLGIRPVAANRTIHHLLAGHASGIAAVDEPFAAEELLPLRPELILVPSFTPKLIVRRLRRIAPALEIDWQDDVYTRLRKLGDLLGREQAAEEWISGYRHRAAAWRDRLEGSIGQGETASAFVVHQGLYVYTGHHFGHTLYKGIGYAVPEDIRRLIEQSPGMKWKRISPEQLAGYAGDRVFLAMHSTGPDAAEALELLNSVHWQRLPAVQAGRSHCMDLALANYNPLTLDAQLEAVGKQLLGISSSPHLQEFRL